VASAVANGHPWSMLIRYEKIFLKNLSQTARNAEFYADFKTVEKISKIFT
jgi:hypothetical protein